MKIAFILPSLEKKGPVIYTFNLIRALKNFGVEIEVFYFRDKIEMDLGVPLHKIDFYKRFNFDSFDVVHTHMAKADLYAAIFLRNKNFILCSTAHNYMEKDLLDLYTPLKRYLLQFVWRNSLNLIKNICVSSKDMQLYYQNILLNVSSNIVVYGVPSIEQRAISLKDDEMLSNLRKRYKVIGSSGSLIERKGFEQLIQFAKYNEDYAVVILGEGPDRHKLEALITNYGLDERFILMGFKNNSVDYYGYFDLYAMTSYSEGFGLAMLEAVSLGLPLVCSKLNVYSEYISDEDVGYFLPNNISSLESAVHKVFMDLDYYRIRSKNLYKEKFDLTTFGQSQLQAYSSFLELKGKN